MTIKHSVKLKCLKMHRSFFNLIGHGVVMEGNWKMTGCLETFGGHCSVLLKTIIRQPLTQHRVKGSNRIFILT